MSSPTIDNTLGAVFLGNLTAAILYGVTCVQMFMYFQTYSRDAVSLKATMFFLWMCDTVHLALITQGVYFYAVTNFANPAPLQDPTLSIMVSMAMTDISDLTIKYIFGRRVWKMSGGNVPLVISIALTSLIAFCSTLGFTGLGIRYKTYSKVSKISYLLYLAFGSGVVADAIITSALCIILAKSRTGFRQTDSLVNILMVYTVNTGLLTGIVAAICLILYTVMPHNYIFLALYFNISKLYLNALLATLNARSNLRNQMNGAIATIPLSGIAEPGSDNSSKRIPASPHIAVNVETYTETKPESLNESTGGYQF